MSSEVRELVIEYIQAVGERRFDRLEELVHPEVEFGGTTAVELQGSPAVVEGLRKLGPIILRKDIKQLTVEGTNAAVLYEFVTDTEVGPVLTAEFLRVEEGKIRAITLLFDWRRWPEDMQELGRRTTRPEA